MAPIYVKEEAFIKSFSDRCRAFLALQVCHLGCSVDDKGRVARRFSAFTPSTRLGYTTTGMGRGAEGQEQSSSPIYVKMVSIRFVNWKQQLYVSNIKPLVILHQQQVGIFIGIKHIKKSKFLALEMSR